MFYEVVGDSAKVDGSALDRVIAEATRRREHVWSMIATFRIDPELPDRHTLLDSENLIAIVGPGCVICEVGYSPEQMTQRCPGVPQ